MIKKNFLLSYIQFYVRLCKLAKARNCHVYFIAKNNQWKQWTSQLSHENKSQRKKAVSEAILDYW